MLKKKKVLQANVYYSNNFINKPNPKICEGLCFLSQLQLRGIWLAGVLGH